MDPNVALAHIREQLDLAERAPSLAHANVHREHACESMRGLDAFLSSGGFSPAAWSEPQRQALENTRRPAWKSPAGEPDEPEPLTRQQTWLAEMQRSRYTGCPPAGDTVDEISGLLEPHPWGAYDDPAVQDAIADHLRGS